MPNNTPSKTGWGIVPLVTIALLLGPVTAGMIGTILPAFGGLRPGGGGGFSLQAWREVAATPGLGTSAWLSLKTGLISTFGAIFISLLLVAGWHGTRAFRAVEQALSPLLAVPHVTAALGLAFLMAPSGWLARLGSPWATGWQRPPDLLILQDPGGWSLIAGLIAKETPFLLLMMLAALPQARPAERLQVALAAGYGRVTGWIFAVFPNVYAQLRLPVYAVLAYGISNVDVALVLGPSTPSMLSVQILRWMSDPDLALRAPAAAAALLQLGLVIIGLALWRLAEAACGTIGRRLLWRGIRGANRRDDLARGIGLTLSIAAALAVIGGLVGHLLWSFAGRWRFPDALPESLRLRTWARHGQEIIDVSAGTLALAFAAALIALVLVIGCLEAEHRRGRVMGRGGLLVLYMPLILPQITFLPGLQILLLQTGASMGWLPVLIAHLVFVLPYVFLSLAGPYRAWDARYATLGAALNASPDRVLWQLRLPMLLGSVLTALAVGMAVSVGQFLPTLLASGGRLPTLTTEALAIASGGDRRAIGAWAAALTLAALMPFVIAVLLPRVTYRNRRGVLDG
ncbi:MAG: ABC transporter permease [Pseudomonadota bacterium]